ncbi:hypothetical protein FHJ31_28045 [Pseudomonas sp. Fig-3]|nr:hypothetical protein FHJ31_28045 [Pseudomonas sp. Fig-3]
MAQRGYPGIHAGMPTAQRLRSASVVNGAPRSTSSARRPDSRPGFGRTRFSCGSEPARDSGGSVCINTECAAFAGKLCSHRFAHRSDWCTSARNRPAIRPPREQALLPQIRSQVRWVYTRKKQAGYQAASRASFAPTDPAQQV